MTSQSGDVEVAVRKVRRLTLRQLGFVMKPFEAELQRLYPEAYRDAVYGGRGTWAVLGEHPEIRVDEKSLSEALDDMERRLAERPPIRVKAGDFVSIRGRVLRIEQVYPDTRQVETARLDANGRHISGGPCDLDYPDGTQLEPIQPEAIDAGDWPPIPGHMKDALARARFVRREHERLLVAAGLADDD